MTFRRHFFGVYLPYGLTHWSTCNYHRKCGIFCYCDYGHHLAADKTTWRRYVEMPKGTSGCHSTL